MRREMASPHSQEVLLPVSQRILLRRPPSPHLLSEFYGRTKTVGDSNAGKHTETAILKAEAESDAPHNCHCSRFLSVLAARTHSLDVGKFLPHKMAEHVPDVLVPHLRALSQLLKQRDEPHPVHVPLGQLPSRFQPSPAV